MIRYEVGEIFRVAEVWVSPRGTIYRVIEATHPSGRQLRLRVGANGTGRSIFRDRGDVLGWVRPPDLNEEKANGGG